MFHSVFLHTFRRTHLCFCFLTSGGKEPIPVADCIVPQNLIQPFLIALTNTNNMSSKDTTNGDDSRAGVAARLARSNILELHPYRCARDDYSTGVLLDANENSFGPTSVPSNSMDPYDNHLLLERYPDPYQIKLKEKFAAYRGEGLKPANIFCGVGSDEAIDLLMRIFCNPGVDNIMTTPPTYGMYKVCAKVNDVTVKMCPLSPDFDVRIEEVSVCYTFLRWCFSPPI